MSWLDLLILLPLLIGLVRGLMRGLVVELTAIVAIILGAVGTKMWGAPFAIWLSQQFAWPEAVCSVVAYALLFLGITLLLNIFAKLLSKLFKAVHLGYQYPSRIPLCPFPKHGVQPLRHHLRGSRHQ